LGKLQFVTLNLQIWKFQKLVWQKNLTTNLTIKNKITKIPEKIKQSLPVKYKK